MGIVKYGWEMGVLMLLTIIAIPVIYFLIVSPQFGILTYLSLAYTIMWFARFTNDFPVGTIMDGMLVFFILGFFIKQKTNKSWIVFKNPITLVVSIWILYNIGEGMNPVADSVMAWLYTVRTVAIIALMYFIFLYHIRTKNFLKTIFKWWIFASLLNAIYALKQEYIGFFYFEQHYLELNPKMAALLFQGGHWRKFSINPDPVTFAFNMVMASILCIALMTGPLKAYRKLILGILAFLFFYVMLFLSVNASLYMVCPLNLRPPGSCIPSNFFRF